MEPQPPSPVERLAPASLAPRLARELGIGAKSIEPALVLLARGAHPPFVARFRREKTGGLDIQALEAISARAARAAQFEFRRASVHEDLVKAGRASELALRALDLAQDGVDLDDFRPRSRKKKKGPASAARRQGLDKLAAELWRHGSTGPLAAGESPGDPGVEPSVLAEPFVKDEVADVEAALAGARAVCEQSLAELPIVRSELRRMVREQGVLRATIVEEKKDKAKRYARFLDKDFRCSKISPPDLLGILRGQREGAIEVEIKVDEEPVLAKIRELAAIDPERPCGELLNECVAASWADALGRAVRTGVRRRLKEAADAVAIRRYCDALRPLLLAPPLGPVPVLAVDPGFQHGCRVVVVNAGGEAVADDTLFPLQPKLQAPQAKARIAELVTAHEVKAIAVSNGNGGRDVERLCRELVRETEDLDVPVISVDGDAAALFASSRAGKEALKDKDAGYRRALSIGRRLQDPLTELTRVDPRKLGLGQYQHEVDQEELRLALDQVLGSCLNLVGVPANSAPAEILARVCGLSQALARAVVAHREAHGPFRTRAQLLDVPGVPGMAFEQASGFLRVEDGEHPLDSTSIHPERYSQVAEMARDLGVPLAELLRNEELVGKLKERKKQYLGRPGVSGEPLGEETFAQVVEELLDPGRELRPTFSAAGFQPQVESFADLKQGADLEGIVTHLATFGVFVDVGLSEEGLVHVSEIAHNFVSSPFEAVHVGQRVKVRVLSVDAEKKRFALSIKALLPAPPRPAGEGKRKRKPKKGEDKRDGRRGDGRAEGRGKKGPRKGGKPGRPRERQPDRVLNFRMDLSDLAARLEEDA